VTFRRAPALLSAGALFPPLLWLIPALALREAPSFRDQGDFFFPLKLYTADRWKRGELALWNPLSGCGEPWLANLQSGVFYPPGLLFLLPSPALAAGLYLLLHFAIAVWGMRRFLREEGCSEAASLAGSAAFAASGIAASLSVYWNHFGAFAYLPALASLARSGLSGRSARLGFAALLALQALSGSPEISAATLAVCLVLAWRARPAPDGHFAAPLPIRLARLGAAAALGLLLAGCTLAPFVELALHSERRAGLAAPERDVGAVAGRSAVASALGLSRSGSGTSYLASLSVGTLVLLLCAAALLERERRSLVLLLAGIAVAGILLAASGPPGSWIRALPPLDRIRYPAKALVLPAFAISVLAGLGLDSVRFAPEARRRGIVLGMAAAGLLLAAFSSQPALARAAEAVGILAVAGLALTPSRRPSAQAALQAVAALLLAASLTIAGRPIFRFAPESEIRKLPDSLSFLAQLPGRVLTPPMGSLVAHVLRDGAFDASALRRQRESLMGYTNLLTGVRTLRTASPLETAASRRIADAIDGAPDLQAAAGAASARLLWTPTLPPNMGSRRVGDYYRAPINPYRPRLSFVRAFTVEPDARTALERMARGGADWRRSVSLDREPSPRPIEGGARRGFVVARLSEDRPERVVAQVDADAAGLLVLTDLEYPGWRAEVDGRPAAILRADGAFRAVALTAGSHRVAFSYRPLSLFLGGALSALAAVALLLLARRGEPRRAGAIL
jgi:Bacterial membrane protein YfhO